VTARAQKTVLVVDDSPLMRRLITEIVEADPDLDVVDVAENGRVALQKVRQHQPDCILLDIEMPELSGLDTMRRLRLRSRAKIIILSHLGVDGSQVRAQAFRLGAAEVIDKPTGAVSSDLRSTRGSMIQQTLRRVLGLPAAPVPDEPVPADGALVMASVLSVDVRDLASLYDRVEATALVALLNEQLEIVDDVTRAHGGVIDAQVGSTTLVAFGVPKRSADHAAHAVAAAHDLLDALARRRAARRDAGAPVLDHRVAVVTGQVLAGQFGPAGAQRYRTMSGALDLAARIGHAGQAYGAELISCRRTLGAVAGAARSRRLDVIQLERGGEPTELYELLTARSTLDAAALDAYARGMTHYETGKFTSAIKDFGDVLARAPADRAAARLLARCRGLVAAPPAAWHGVWPIDAAWEGER